MTQWLPLIFTVTFFGAIGVAATFFTDRLRAYWIRQSERHPEEFHWRLVGRRVRKPWYSIELRLIGLLSLGTVLLILWGLLRPWL